MAIKSSFVSTVEQIVKLNENNISVLAGLNEIVQSSNSTVDITVLDANDLPTTVALPTVGNLQSQINQINQNIKTLSGIGANGAIVQPSNNVFQKIILANLNAEPNPVGQLNEIANFNSSANSFFDALLNPKLSVQLDLSNQIQNNVRHIISRRYIIDFDEDASGNLTAQAQTSINLFNEQFKGRTDITISEIESWILNTPAIVPQKNGSVINYDEETFQLEPNSLQYNGLFTVTGTQQDVVNQKLWYYFDTLTYFEIATGAVKTLAVDDELIINASFSATRFKVIEISTAASNLRVRLETVEGYEPVPVALTGGLKFYSPVIVNKKVDITIGFNEYCVIFVKPIDDDNFLVAREWSSGTAFYTNDLRLLSTDNTGQNGTLMTDYYVNTVSDYGRVLEDLVNTRIPLAFVQTPHAPTLNVDNFVVRQTNKNITDTADSLTLKNLHAQANNLRSQLTQLNQTLQQKRDQLVKTRFKNAADKTKVENEIAKLIGDQENVTKNLQAITNQIVSQDNLVADAEPLFEVQGFWSIPATVSNGNTRGQEVAQFIVNYRYLSNSGQDNPTQSLSFTNTDGTKVNATVSNWIEFYTKVRPKTFDITTQRYVWAAENLSDPDTINSNQLSIPIKPNENVEIRIKSISEVGYPENIITSDWSTSIIINFPTDLIPTKSRQEQITQQANLDNVRLTVEQDLNTQGLDKHLAQGFVANNTYYSHSTDNIAVTQVNGSNIITLTEKLNQISASNASAAVEDLKNLILTNSWSNFGGQYSPAQYYVDRNRVYLNGLIRLEVRSDNQADDQDFTKRYPDLIVRSDNPALNTQYCNIATLPDGYKPDKIHVFMVPSSQGNDQGGGNGNFNYQWGREQRNNAGFNMARVDVYPNGLIRLVSGATGFVSLEGISFRISSTPLQQQATLTDDAILQLSRLSANGNVGI